MIENFLNLEFFQRFLAHEKSLVALPSSARKCWAKKVRQYLYMKSMLFNITVTDESELLSLLATSDIRTIGGEIFLTWGGPALSSIILPEVVSNYTLSYL